MNYNEALELLQNTISEINLPHNPLLEELDKKEPVIYLCGKIATGKTTFLNALLNREKDELFTSTDISTKTEFRFIYGDEPSYQTNDVDKRVLPSTFAERKELFTRLNLEGNKCTIELLEKALKGRTIVDIPGILDYTNNKKHIQKMIIDADIVCFFTPSIGKINHQEYELLKELTDAGVPIVFLFTMSDMTDPDEGVTRKTLPEYVQNRINDNLTEIKIASHFIVSATDFYKGKDSHNIDTFLTHIQSNEVRYFDNAKNSRSKRLFKFYIEYLENEIAILKQDAEQVESLINRENELWYENEKIKIENEHSSATHTICRELERFKKQCKNYLLMPFLESETYRDETVSREEKKEEFISMWDKFWKQLQDGYEKILTTPPLLPPMPSSLFKTLKIDADKKDDLINKLSRIISDEDRKNSQHKDERNKNNSMSKKEKIKIEDIIKIGINLKNASVIFEHWKYLNAVTDEINATKEVLLLNFDNLLKQQELELNKESEIRIKDAVKEDNTIQKLESYKSAVSNLKKVSDYA